MENKPVFEHEVCGRCCGTGKYSFNLIHGDRCYGCGGSGYKLTKRGHAAQQYLNTLRTRNASEVNVGDLILFDNNYKKLFAYVKQIRDDELNVGQDRITFTMTDKCGKEIGKYNCFKATQIRFAYSAEEKAAQIKQALEYQDTLTKAGVVSKKKAKKD